MEPTPSTSPTRANDTDSPGVPSEQLALDLRIVSPSLPQPISILEIAAAATVGQVKEKIRSRLPGGYSESSQRLICRGRMLNRDDETLLNLFGEDLVSCPNGHGLR
jgi:hypothetical protein